MNATRVVIVDAEGLFREGLKTLLQAHANWVVVGEASDGAQGLALTRELKPDLVLMDIRMNGMDGLEATRQIMAEMSDCRVVILTASEKKDDFIQAIKNGAQGYILKRTDPEQFFCLIQGALAGGIAISGPMTDRMIKELSVPASSKVKGIPKEEKLSKREWQVLNCLKDGPTNRQIAEQLAISESTVKKHLHRIFKKLRLENRSQAAVVAGKTS
ncbi:MAG: response regulator transcription factor [Chloroflexi bacterium]|nr:response regulator transcription factor [Chloroflexota bacterium]